MQRPGVVDVNGQWRDLENIVLKPVDMAVGPETESSIFGQAVASDARAWEDNIAVGGPNLNGLDHLDQVHAVALGKQAPLVEKGQNRGPEAIFNYFCRLRFDGSIQHIQGVLVGIDHLIQKRYDPLGGFRANATTNAPKVPNAGDIVLARHHPLKAVG